MPPGYVRPNDGAEVVADEIRKMGGSATSFIADLSVENDCLRLVSDVVSTLGSCDIVVNNAAAPHGSDRVDVADVSTAAFDSQVNINLRASFLIARSAIPNMRQRQWGRVVNVASVAAVVGVKNRASYAASKAGLIGLARSMAVDVAGDGITVNTVCPGVILTGRNLATIQRPDSRDQPGAWPPMGQPADVAWAVAYFASEASSFVTGQVLIIDGGMSSTLRN